MDDGEICRRTRPDRVGGLVPSAQPTGTTTVLESTSSMWTDEKHSLYLNSIEESFVKELHSRDFRSTDFHGWLLGNKKVQNSSTSNLGNLYSGQFKVQRRGCWEELKFVRRNMKISTAHGSHNLSANKWIQHFRSPTAGSWRQDKNGDRITSLSNQVPSHHDSHCQELVGSRTEVSDQNFVDEESEEDKTGSKACRKKRTRDTDADADDDASTKDQVVPLGKMPILSPVENYNPWKKKGADSSVHKPKT